jgi:tetratricopeptide (TPR) repeat protein
MNSLGCFYMSRGRNAEAEDLFKRVLAIYEKALEPGHPHKAITLGNLGDLYVAEGAYGKAEPLLRGALKIIERTLPPEHPHLITALEALAFFCRKTGRPREAEELEMRAASIPRIH